MERKEKDGNGLSWREKNPPGLSTWDRSSQLCSLHSTGKDQRLTLARFGIEGKKEKIVCVSVSLYTHKLRSREGRGAGWEAKVFVPSKQKEGKEGFPLTSVQQAKLVYCLVGKKNKIAISTCQRKLDKTISI